MTTTLAQPARTPAQDPKITRVLAVTTRLTEILAQEYELLKAGRPREITRFQDEKTKLTGYYRREMNALKAAAQSLDGTDPVDLGAVRSATEAFVKVLREHDRVLVAKKTATEGMLQAIGKEVARRDKPVESYGKDGGLRPAMPTYAATRPTTLSLDRRI